MTLDRQSIWFLLNGEPITTRVQDPTQNVLTHLRRAQGLMGTKEGCAEGDCGACTVVLGELIDGKLQMRTVNACILFLPALDGKALFTVEYLRRMSDGLHPVQQAMVDCHGSQCGFCTPGFIMSLWDKYNDCLERQHRPERQELADHLSGNLCRCTGYKPILEAGQRMFELPACTLDRQAIAEALQGHVRATSLQLPGSNGEAAATALKPAAEAEALSEALAEPKAGNAPDQPTMTWPVARYAAPRSLAELLQLRAERPEATLLAGGTDVGLWVNKLIRTVEDVLYIGAVPELQNSEIDDEWLCIGAGVSLEQAHARLLEYYPQLHEIAVRFASVPIRNAGTLGGNVANGSPIGDSAPWLMALGAQVELASVHGTRRIPIDALYTGYMRNAMQSGELLSAIRVPLPRPDQQFRCYKLSKRYDSDISAVCGAFRLLMQDAQIVDARVAFGGMAATVQRASACEAVLNGATWNEATLQAACTALAGDYTPMSDMRASADYRQRTAQNLLRRFHLETRPDAPLRLDQLSVFARTDHHPGESAPAHAGSPTGVTR